MSKFKVGASPEREAEVQAEAEAIIRDAMRFRAWLWKRNTQYPSMRHHTERMIREMDERVAAGKQHTEVGQRS